MSVVVTVAGVAATAIGTPVFSGVCAAVAASLGLRALEGAEVAAQQEEAERARAAMGETLDVTVATEAALSELVAERCSMTFADDKITMQITRDIRGQITIRAHGEGIRREEVSARAAQLLGKIRQQLAYRQILQKMKSHGFAVDTETQQADGTVRVHIRRKTS